MNDRFGAGEALDRLPEVGEVCKEERRGVLAWSDEVHREHLVVVLDQVGDDRASGLPARAGDEDLHRRDNTARYGAATRLRGLEQRTRGTP